MDRNELLQHLSEYGTAVNQGNAKTANFVDIKNKIRQAYDAGNIDKQLMKDLSDKATGAFKNMGRSVELENLPNKIIQKGGTVSGIEGMTNRFAPAEQTVSKLGGKFGKTMKALGILGPAAAALSIGDKAMAGDFGGAGMEAVDQATDYAPIVGEVKQAIRPSEMGNSELPPEIMQAQQKFNQQVRNTSGGNIPQSEQEIPKYDDSKDTLTKRYNFLNKLK